MMDCSGRVCRKYPVTIPTVAERPDKNKVVSKRASVSRSSRVRGGDRGLECDARVF